MAEHWHCDQHVPPATSRRDIYLCRQKGLCGRQLAKGEAVPTHSPLPPTQTSAELVPTCMQIWVAACPNEESRGKGWFIDALWTQYDVAREVCACVFYFFEGRFC